MASPGRPCQVLVLPVAQTPLLCERLLVSNGPSKDLGKRGEAVIRHIVQGGENNLFYSPVR